jgi:hypothetical protein
MAVAPARPLVHAYLGEGGDPFEIIDSPFGRMEREKAKAMATGEFSGLVELSKQIRNDVATMHARQEAREAELNARQDAIVARELQHAVAVTQFTDFVGKAAVLFDRIQKARADQQEEPLVSPPGFPDPGEPSKSPEPSLALEGDAIPGTQAPSGELHVVPAEDEPAVEDEAEFPTGEELPHPPVVQQPIAAGLDHED